MTARLLSVLLACWSLKALRVELPAAVPLQRRQRKCIIPQKLYGLDGVC